MPAPFGPPSLSLLDLAGRRVVKWYVAYLDSPDRRWWTRFLRPGFQHVQLWRPVQYGPRVSDTFWIVVDPGMECVITETRFQPEPPWVADPSMIVQHVTAICTEKRVRNWAFFGPITCIEIAKAYLGLSSVWLRTPLQLYKHISARNGVLTQR